MDVIARGGIRYWLILVAIARGWYTILAYSNSQGPYTRLGLRGIAIARGRIRYLLVASKGIESPQVQYTT